MRRYVDEKISLAINNVASGIQTQKEKISLKDELEMKNIPGGLEGIQEQINRLGEEVALDINDLEKRLNQLITQVNRPAFLATPSNQTPFQQTI